MATVYDHLKKLKSFTPITILDNMKVLTHQNGQFSFNNNGNFKFYF